MVTPVRCLFSCFWGFMVSWSKTERAFFFFFGEFSCRFLSSKGRGDGTARGGAGC